MQNMQNQFLIPGPVLRKDGSPIPGYSFKSILQYDRKAIKAPFYRIKEWDFYQVSDDKMCLQFTIGHASYAGQVGIMLFDFKEGVKLAERGTILPLPFNSLHMPCDGEVDHVLSYGHGNRMIRFEAKGDKRYLICKWDDFNAKIRLTRQNHKSIVVNIPFKESRTAFYYNQKINCMTADGEVSYKDGSYCFSKDNTFGLLDWGRGVWPFHNEWYWSNGTGYVNGKIFGFNLGCGFGNPEHGTENVIFYGDEVIKLYNVVIKHEEDYMKPWHIYDDEKKVDLVLTPTYDRTTKVKLLWVDNCCHQMFGEFTGYVTLNDGRRLEISNVIAFAEHAVNNW